MSSSTSLSENPLMARLRDKLRAEGINLWEPPFYQPTTRTPKDREVKALGLRYATELELCEDDVTKCLFSLQQHALEKFAEREEFKSTGKATIRFKYSGKMTEDGKDASLTKVQISLSENNGKDLKGLISGGTGIPAGHMKLICSGKVIDDHKLLDVQGLKNGSQVMILIVGTSLETLQDVENQFKELEEIKASADYLSSNGRSKVYLELQDQAGRSLKLPEEERKALAVALALHNKGRGAMKLNDYSKALIFLLEADSAYSQCRTALLNTVDNYGILNLDIAWCYLNLKSIAELPDAERRLQKCEEALAKSYGKNLERVTAIKGSSSGWEAALFARLHLLQAIAAYHLGHIEKSRFLLSKVEEELSRLKVSDEKMATLIEMGFKENECIMALRANNGDVEASSSWIIERMKLEVDRLEAELLRTKLGVCDDGQEVNANIFLQLKEMGFSPELSGAALRRANNDVDRAIQLLSDDNFIREIQATNIFTPSTTTTTTNGGSGNANASSSGNAVAGASGDSSQNQNQAGAGAGDLGLDSELIQRFADILCNLGIPNGFGNANTIVDDMEKSEKAYQSLAKDTCSEEEYIDLALSAETRCMEEYKSLLDKFA